jgi:hypothetical protein
MSPSSLSCSVVADVVRAERVRQSSSGRLVVAHVVEASKGRVQDGLLHDDGDKAIIVVPRHVSSVAAALFIAHHPRHHRPCRPNPLLCHRCCRSPATLVTVAIALTALFVTALIMAMCFRCCSSPAVMLLSTARLQNSRR